MKDGNKARIATLTQSMLMALEDVACADDLRQGIADTPWRVSKMWAECLQGYDTVDGKEILARTFQDDIISTYNGMVIVKDIKFFSHCEHHLCPFYGHAHIGYIPGNGTVVGLSKLARLVEIYSKRLQVQERMTQQILNDLVSYLMPEGVMVVVEAIHTCMVMRGVQSPDALTITSACSGAMFDTAAARMEFLHLIKKG